MKRIERENEKRMYKVIWKDNEKEFNSLNSAMDWAKTLDHFVKISGGDFEVVGKFGVDSVRNGKCPDGIAYDWNKSSRIGAVKRRS